jgi:hypothetical protein
VTAASTLTEELRPLLKELEDDLRERVAAQPDVAARWQAEYDDAITRQRTAAAWGAWRDDRVTQAAVAWVLVTVFIRFCEDHGLVAPVWISGPKERRQEALDAQLAYFREHGEHTDREWIEQAIAYLAKLPATAALVDEHSALHLVSPSGDAAAALLVFWRERDEAGELVHPLPDDDMSTRFLGDLYQNLSEYARERYALLQTPEFVEEFILDRTLEPALAERPLDDFKLIDPACGSGHFLLGAFPRLLDRWHRHSPDLETQARVQKALDAIHGVDVNPFAVAIARFRLTVAAFQECGLRRLEDAPAFRFHLAVGDSLLHGSRQQSLDFGPEHDPDAALSGHAYSTEDLHALRKILQPDRYDAVVGNPPYITPRDKALNTAYRKLHKTCKGKYALTVPFMERFFELAKPRVGDWPAGWVGLLTSNSFMKREFGVPLIESFLIKKDLRLVIDTSGVYIPGHGTPTLIIVSRNNSPEASSVRAVLGVRGEPGRPQSPAKGVVWTSIVEHIDQYGYEDPWITVADLEHSVLASHPWSLAGGGAVETLRQIEAASPRPLGKRLHRIGFFGVIGADDAAILPTGVVRRINLEEKAYRRLVVGDEIRDFAIQPGALAWFPYNEQHELRPLIDFPVSSKRLWPYRTELGNRATFGGRTYFSERRPWYEWHQLPRDTDSSPLSIAFAFVATHNHFALDRDGRAFGRTAPVIKLSKEATESDHLALLGTLNSSTACFWLKQKSQNRGSTVDTAGARTTLVPWENFYEFTGKTLQAFPLPSQPPLELARQLDLLSQKLANQTPAILCESGAIYKTALEEAREEHDKIRMQMIAVQEELDWQVYQRYGLVHEDLTYPGNDLPELRLGERAFEIAMAMGQKGTDWFARHRSTPVTEIPRHWPGAYRNLVRRRLELIGNNKTIGLLERPEYKRRWLSEPWEQQEQRALRDWLLDRLENRRFWFDTQGRPAPRSVGQLADEVARDADLSSVLALWAGRPDAPVTETLVKLLGDQAVPYMAAYRYKESGLRKRAAWERTWELQRREDRGEKLDRPIPVPPKYTSADFAKSSYWHHRGKLDVPKERFILYPDAGRDNDPTPLLGWAGWDHAQQALALNAILQQREAEGRPDERLVPLVAGLAELQPWIDQWHTKVDPTYGVSMAAFCAELLTERMVQVGKTVDELKEWKPEPPRRGRRQRTTGARP